MKNQPTSFQGGPWTALKTDTTPVMTTAHLTEAEGARPARDWPTRCYESPYGFLVYVGAPPELGDPYPADDWPGMAQIVKWARYHRYDWVRFDNNADEQPGLPTYEW